MGPDQHGRGAFSPDGSRLAFTRRHAGSMDIYLLPLYGESAQPKALTTGGGN